jgi:hypothetical protein
MTKVANASKRFDPTLGGISELLATLARQHTARCIARLADGLRSALKRSAMPLPAS